MIKLHKFTMTMPLLIAVSLFFGSCVQATGSRAKSISKASLTGAKGVGSAVGSGAVDTSTTTTTDPTLFTQQVELSHLVDPFDGTYKKKVTLPKNFKGNLYIAGLNVAALTNKLVSVRFNFGMDKQSVTLQATVARAPGITPKTDIQVLVVDMNSRPFNNMRLGYDLFDYNDYNDPTKDIVSDPRDGGLYCRGLLREDDPTSSSLTGCSNATDRCLYSYAKIVDSTLYTSSAGNVTSSIPTRSEVWTENSGVRSPSVTTLSNSVCLPDDGSKNSVNDLFGLSLTSLNIDDRIFAGLSNSGIYRGPYRSINEDAWQITGDARFNVTSGLFQVTALPQTTGYRSLLFPRAGKLSLSQGVVYMGSATHNLNYNPQNLPPIPQARIKSTSDSTGVSNYVDGCNIRALNFNPSTNEGISSCNVNASIEVFYMLDGKEVNITTDKTIKLQLIRPSITNYQGKEVLTTSFKQCENSTTSGSDECCFNSRCWSKDLVTQCVDQTPVIGNQEIGSNCSSDYECSSLCCNQSTGSCAPHNPNGTSPLFCNKTAGQQCVSKEFCQQIAVVTCKIVKSGFKADGTAACTLRCPAVMTYGDCKSGSCVPPVQPAVPAFDPNNCTQAVDP